MFDRRIGRTVMLALAALVLVAGASPRWKPTPGPQRRSSRGNTGRPGFPGGGGLGRLPGIGIARGFSTCLLREGRRR